MATVSVLLDASVLGKDTAPRSVQVIGEWDNWLRPVCLERDEDQWMAEIKLQAGTLESDYEGCINSAYILAQVTTRSSSSSMELRGTIQGSLSSRKTLLTRLALWLLWVLPASISRWLLRSTALM